MVEFFHCGRYYSLEKVGINRGDFFVTKISDILNKIIPFFDNYPLVGIKSKAFQKWKAVAEFMLKGEHLTEEGLKKIRIIKDDLNKVNSELSNKSSK